MEFSAVYRIILAVLNIIVNLFILMLGMAVLAIGIAGVVLVNQLNASAFILFFNTAFGLVIAIGLFIAIVSFFSIVGSYTSYASGNKALRGVSICLLVIAVCGMTIVLLCGIAGVVLTVIYQSFITMRFTSGLLALFNDTLVNNPSSIEEIIVTLQVTFKCCGVNGPSDYANIPTIGNNTALPGGCCFGISNCTLSGDPTLYRTDGCGVILLDLLTTYSYVMIGLGVAILVIAITVILLPLLLICLVAKKSENLMFV